MNKDYFYLGAAPDNPRRLFVLPIATAQRHGVITGRTGGGKTGLIDDLCGQFIAEGRGFTVVDCKGDLANDVLAMLAMTPEEGWRELARDVVLVDPSDRLCTATFNPLEVPSYTTPARQRQDVMAILRRLWGIDDAQTARMVLVLRKTMQLLMFHQLTIVEATRVLTDQTFRERLVQSCDDAQLRRFWLHEFPEGTTNQLAWTQSSLIRLESLVDDPNVCAFLGQPQSSLNFREIMDGGKICIVSPGRGRLGHESANLIAGLLLVHLQLAAESRQRLPQDQRRPHFLFCDEVQQIAGPTFEEFLSMARGFGLSVFLAHQNLSQLAPSLQEAIIANTGVKITFNSGHEDSSRLSKEMWRVAGERVRDRRLAWANIGRLTLPVGWDYQFYSASEEMRQNRELLQFLPDRHMVVHLAGETQPYLARTVDVPRDEFDRAGEQVARFKRVMADVQRQPAIEAPPDQRMLPAARTFEWAGRGQASAPVGSQR